jgi:hypothetical protein
MKPIILILCLCGIFSCKYPNHKVTYTDIIGTWEWDDLTNQQPPSIWVFTDKTHFIWYSDKREFSKLTYTLDTLSNPTIFNFVGVRNTDSILTNSIRLDSKMLLKLIDKNTIKLQGAFRDNKPNIEWDDNETIGNTGILKRIK